MDLMFIDYLKQIVVEINKKCEQNQGIKIYHFNYLNYSLSKINILSRTFISYYFLKNLSTNKKSVEKLLDIDCAFYMIEQRINILHCHSINQSLIITGGQKYENGQGVYRKHQGNEL
jgi:hypothetical protein